MPIAVILTALRVEYLAVRAHLSELREEIHPRGTVYEHGRFETDGQPWEVAIVEVGKGNPTAAVEAERVIQHCNPDVALFVGVAGGLKDVRLGDVVAGTKVYGYESGKDEADFRPRPELHPPDYALLQRALAVSRGSHWHQRILGTSPGDLPDAHTAPIAAGQTVVASRESATFRLLRANYGDAVAVEMEGYGFLAAAYANTGIRALVVRGISDLVENKAEVDAAGYQEIASRHASAFAFEILATLDHDRLAGRRPVSHPGLSERPAVTASHSGLLQPRSSRFPLIGRARELAQISASLREGGTVVLHGLGGIGKSSIAAEAARQLHAGGAFADVMWITAPDTGSIDTLCDAVARDLGNTEVPSLVGPTKLAATRQLLAGHPGLLIVLDDVATPEVGAVFVDQCLPERMAVLVTSRRRQPAFVTDIHVGALNRDAAITLFCDRARLSSANEAVAEICDLLEHHPLALVIAAGRQRAEEMPLENLRSRLADEKLRLAVLRLPEADDPDHNVRSCLRVSWEGLGDNQRHVLTRLAACYADTTLELLAGVTQLSQPECEDRVGELVVRSLVDREGDRFHLHQLVRDLGREEAGQELGPAQAVVWTAVQDYVQRYGQQADVLGHQEKLQSELGNILGVIRHSAIGDDPSQRCVALLLAPVLVHDAGLLRRRGYSSERGDLARLILRLAEDLGDEKLWAETALLTATAIADEGRRDEALSLLQRSYEILQKQGDDASLEHVLLNMGNLASSLGDREGAYRCYALSLAIAKKRDDRVGVAAARGQTGMLALNAGILGTAQRLYRESLETYRVEQHRQGMAACLHHLGEIGHHLGHDAVARDLYRESLQLEREIGSLPGVVVTLEEILKISTSEADIEEVIAEYRGILDDYERRGNLEGVAAVLKQMGDAAMHLGDLDGANDHYLRSLEIKRRFGNKRGMAVSLGQLGYLAQRRGDIQGARRFAEQSLDNYVAVRDEDGIARCLFQLGQLAEAENDPALARTYYRDSLNLWRHLWLPGAAAAATALLALSEHSGDDMADSPGVGKSTPTVEATGSIVGSRRPSGSGAEQDLLFGAWSGPRARAYLSEQTGQTDEATAELAEWLGAFPPALDLAATFIRTVGITLSEYFSSFRARQRELTGQPGPSADYRAVMRTTVALSLEHLNESPAAADLVKLGAFLAPSAIRLTALQAGATELPEPLSSAAKDLSKLHEHVAVLERFALLSSSDGQLLVHPLVQQAVLCSLSLGDQRDWADAAVRLVSVNFPTSLEDPETWLEADRLLPHALVTTGHCEVLGMNSSHAAALINNVGSYFRMHGRLVDSLLAHDHALAISEDAAGPDSPAIAVSLNNLAGALLALGDMEGAQGHYERALAILHDPHPEYWDDMGKMVSNYGHLLLDKGDLEEAWAHFDWARDLHEQLHGRNHLTTAIDVHNLGLVRRAQHRWSDARALLEDALDRLQVGGQGNTPIYATTMLNLGTVLFRLNDRIGARRCLDDTIALRERLLGEHHPDFIDTVSSLAAFLESTGDVSGARGHLNRAVRLALHAFGRRHVVTQKLLNWQSRLGT